MDYGLFSSLIRNLLHTEAFTLTGDHDGLSQLETRYCYDPKLQPLFTAQSLGNLLRDAEDGVLYEIQDRLGISALFFLLEGAVMFVGPYVRGEFDRHRTQRALIDCRMSASYIPSIQLYYSAFPLLGSSQVKDTVAACISAFTGTGGDLKLCRIDETVDKVGLPRADYSENLDYSTLFSRYERENRFWHMVKTGDTENVLTAFLGMTIQGVSDNRYVNAVYQDPVAGLSMVRVLARKAAEAGGASPIEINEITQRAVQKMVSARSIEDKLAVNNAMILELTEAVQRQKLRLEKYSPPIRKVVEYLHLNYSQMISFSHLASIAAFSEAHLSRQFRKESGMTVTQYLAGLRCREAADMLLGSDIPVSEIAAYVGYEDNNYFVKVFRKQYGMTPTAYRSRKEKDGV